MGIPKDKQDEIYTKFTRLIPSYKGTHSGTELGLSNVKKLIEDLNGEIELESDVAGYFDALPGHCQTL
jgi:two-component system, OmpR family, aerobic respiration control sensor histidine kinase ArcB